MPGDAIATPWAVQSKPIERGDAHKRQFAMHPKHLAF